VIDLRWWEFMPSVGRAAVGAVRLDQKATSQENDRLGKKRRVS